MRRPPPPAAASAAGKAPAASSPHSYASRHRARKPRMRPCILIAAAVRNQPAADLPSGPRATAGRWPAPGAVGVWGTLEAARLRPPRL